MTKKGKLRKQHIILNYSLVSLAY